jgi:hypothetical protein
VRLRPIAPLVTVKLRRRIELSATRRRNFA